MFTRLLGAVRILTGIWLMYLTCATVLDLELRPGVPT
ncbi:hypothetical protein HEB94_005873 [Actinopolymorpha pittospori]|uniref:Uncharacterized protein n=1 Tax=Actinopolymorpha pittospori TaxID=648752 RepID=A0A927N5S7_9ACTN|nr:hypothetical protein [Actinopolymorpha pittospori]